MSLATTVDGVCRGVLELEQPREGYRFNIDPVILAGFAAARVAPPTRIVDLGAGVGIVGLLLARRFPKAQVLLVELQLELAELAAANVRRNGLEDRVEVRCLDLREAERWSGSGPTLLVSNPPFFPAGAGRPSTRPQVSLAKHEITCTLDGLLASLARGLSVGDELALVYPYPREAELLRGLEAHGCPALRVQRVQPLPGRAAARTMVLARRGAAVRPGPAEDPVLVVEEEPGRYSPACQAVLEPGAWVVASASQAPRSP